MSDSTPPSEQPDWRIAYGARLRHLEALSAFYAQREQALRIISGSRDRARAISQLRGMLDLDREQAEAILDSRLVALTGEREEEVRRERNFIETAFEVGDPDGGA